MNELTNGGLVIHVAVQVWNPPVFRRSAANRSLLLGGPTSIVSFGGAWMRCYWKAQCSWNWGGA